MTAVEHLPEEVERRLVASRLGVAPGALERMTPASPSELDRVLGRLSPEAASDFDVSDEARPRLRRRCRSCRVEKWFEFPGGVVPALLPFLAVWICEPCSLAEDEAVERTARIAAVAERRAKSGMTESLMSEVSWSTMLDAGATGKETAERGRAIARAKSWATNDSTFVKPGLLLYGPPGSGKTRLAATAALQLLDTEMIRWVSVAVLMAELQGAWNDDDRKAALKVLTSRAAVVLDDFDKVNPTPSVLGQLFAALDKREQAKSKILVTTNLAPAELERKLSDPVVSRLVGMCEILPFPGPDRRVQMEVGA